MFNKIKQLKEMRDSANQMKQVLAQESIHADVAHGKINIVMNGNQEVLSLEIDPELLTPDKKQELEAGIKEVINEAIKKVQRVMAQKIQSMGGLNMPGL